MALSTSEHTLLVETCDNMNNAANTCREVLEMLRNLGNTGVVDIAVHDNGATAHESATNLVQVITSGSAKKAVLGTAGEMVVNLSEWSDKYPIEIHKNNLGSGISLYNELRGRSGIYNTFTINTAVTDSDGDLESFSSGVIIGKISGVGHSLNLDSTAALTFGVGVYYTTAENYQNCSYIHVNLTDGSGTLKDAYTFQYNLFGPSSSNIITKLGSSAAPFDTAYFRTAPTTTSDKREKIEISDISSSALDFVKALRPIKYKVRVGSTSVATVDENGEPTEWNEHPGVRTHWGLIAQEVQEALVSAGYDPSDCAVWSLADKDDPDSKQALRYEELIAPMIKVIQNQQERIEALERKVA